MPQFSARCGVAIRRAFRRQPYWPVSVDRQRPACEMIYEQKKTPKDILGLIVYSVVGVGAMLMLIHFLGELHGLISTMVVFIGQTGYLYMRVGMLERQLGQAPLAGSGQRASI